jgi:glycosyltransferase involved in cell wall biosynthesis
LSETGHTGLVSELNSLFAGARMGDTRQPTVSIVMATYRRPHTIERTVKLIRAQTYKDWELIVVNNARAGDYQFDDRRIRGYRHAAHASASYARNEGLRYVTGDLVCFFDDDDDMFPTYLEQIVKAFQEHPDARMVRCGRYRGDGEVDFTLSTPVCCLRREQATPTWQAIEDQEERYYGDIVETNGWSEEHGDIVVIPEVLVRARCSPRGGLRGGRP